MKKVKKITPIKNTTLCMKCKYHTKNSGCKGVFCRNCGMYDTPCKCLRISRGEPCLYFVRETEEAQQ